MCLGYKEPKSCLKNLLCCLYCPFEEIWNFFANLIHLHSETFFCNTWSLAFFKTCTTRPRKMILLFVIERFVPRQPAVQEIRRRSMAILQALKMLLKKNEWKLLPFLLECMPWSQDLWPCLSSTEIPKCWGCSSRGLTGLQIGHSYLLPWKSTFMRWSIRAETTKWYARKKQLVDWDKYIHLCIKKPKPGLLFF